TENVGKDLAFVVGRAPRENISVFQNRLERRRIPKLERIWRLHIVMPINQNVRPSFSMFVARPNNRMTGCGDNFRLQPDPGEFLREPFRAVANFGGKLIVSRNAWEPQERVELLQIIWLHEQSLARNAQRSTPN